MKMYIPFICLFLTISLLKAENSEVLEVAQEVSERQEEVKMVSESDCMKAFISILAIRERFEGAHELSYRIQKSLDENSNKKDSWKPRNTLFSLVKGAHNVYLEQQKNQIVEDQQLGIQQRDSYMHELNNQYSELYRAVKNCVSNMKNQELKNLLQVQLSGIKI